MNVRNALFRELNIFCALALRSRIQNKEWTVHGQMAEYFNKCLAIYRSTTILYNFVDLVIRKRTEYFYILSKIANFGRKMADGRLLF